MKAKGWWGIGRVMAMPRTAAAMAMTAPGWDAAYTTGQIGQAFSFDGTNYINVPNLDMNILHGLGGYM